MKITNLNIGVALLTMVLIASLASADTFTEIGDAGDLPATAQEPFGANPLTAISGTLTNNFDVDMYAIFLPGGGTFSATTFNGLGTLLDSQLFLFDSLGNGVYANDDAVDGFTYSTLPAGHALTPLASGIYYLAISGGIGTFGRDPRNPVGLIFPSSPKIGVYGPTGPGGGSPVTTWAGTGRTGTYTIYLTGAQFVNPVPETGTLTLVGSAALMLLAAGAWRSSRRNS